MPTTNHTRPASSNPGQFHVDRQLVLYALACALGPYVTAGLLVLFGQG